jgi:hypothetical protein
MGVRPPANDDSEPDVIEFGIAALEPKLEDAEIEYPTDSRSLKAKIGGIEVPYDASGSTMQLETALEQLEGATFDSQRELLNSLHPVFERKRERAGNGIVSQLRALVPF